ncbi:MAG: type II 3-dehydroquinate dehydratase [Actinomycetota bacterium]
MSQSPATIFILNGPSLNLLGEREPDIYGTDTIEALETKCRGRALQAGFEIVFRQTNDEGELVGWIQQARLSASGIIINPAAFSHYSVAVRDALSAVGLPVIEVHISNIYAREEWRAKSVVSGVARGVIAGLGFHGYLLAIEAMSQILDTA